MESFRTYVYIFCALSYHYQFFVLDIWKKIENTFEICKVISKISQRVAITLKKRKFVTFQIEQIWNIYIYTYIIYRKYISFSLTEQKSSSVQKQKDNYQCIHNNVEFERKKKAISLRTRSCQIYYFIFHFEIENILITSEKPPDKSSPVKS